MSVHLGNKNVKFRKVLLLFSQARKSKLSQTVSSDTLLTEQQIINWDEGTSEEPWVSSPAGEVLISLHELPTVQRPMSESQSAHERSFTASLLARYWPHTPDCITLVRHRLTSVFVALVRKQQMKSQGLCSLCTPGCRRWLLCEILWLAGGCHLMKLFNYHYIQNIGILLVRMTNNYI